MATHRWTFGKPLHRHNTGERIERGDEFEPSDAERQAFGDRMEELDDESDDEPVDEAEQDDSDTQSLTDLNGVGESVADGLREAGYESVDAVRGASVEDLVAIDGIGETLATELSEVGE